MVDDTSHYQPRGGDRDIQHTLGHHKGNQFSGRNNVLLGSWWDNDIWYVAVIVFEANKRSSLRMRVADIAIGGKPACSSTSSSVRHFLDQVVRKSM